MLQRAISFTCRRRASQTAWASGRRAGLSTWGKSTRAGGRSRASAGAKRASVWRKSYTLALAVQILTPVADCRARVLVVIPQTRSNAWR
eukprot:9213673-Pyramimonas_sp.AAC.1